MGAPKYGRGHEFTNWSQTVFVFKCPEKQNSDVRLDLTSKANGNYIGQFHKKGQISPKKFQFNKKGLPFSRNVKILKAI